MSVILGGAAGCPILARLLRKGGIPRPCTPWWFDVALNFRGVAL
jgi:hypothetical protein